MDGQPYGVWANLSADLLDRVRAEFGENGHSMIRVARQVNRHWCAWATQATDCLALCGGQHVGRMVDVLAPKFNRVRRLKLKYPFGCDDRALARLAGFRSLTHLELQECRDQALSAEAVASLATIPKLSKLHFCSHPALMYCSVTDAVAAKLTGCTALRELCLSYCQITDRGLAGLAALTGLSRLGLEGCRHVTDDGVSALARLTSLTDLDLAECSEVTARGAASLAPLTGLTKLGLLVNGRARGAGLGGLAGMCRLSELLLDADLTDEDMRCLGGLTSLRTVHLKWKWNCSVAVTDAGMAALAGLTGLRELGLVFLNVQVEGRVTDAGVRCLEALTALTSLIFIPGTNRVTNGALVCLRAMPSLADLRWGGALTSVGLKSLGCLKRLTALAVRVPLTYDVVRSLRPLTCLSKLHLQRVGYTRPTIKGFRALGTLTALRELSMNGIDIDDDSLRSISGLSRLRRLRLVHSCGQITNTGLRCLSSLGALAEVCLHPSWSVTDEGLAYLRALPNLQSLYVVARPQMVAI